MLINYQMERYSFCSRGIGLEHGSCFVCGQPQPPTLLSNICAVVNAPEREKVLSLFDGGARAHGSRDNQVIVCACKAHERSLEYLHALSKISMIMKADVNASKVAPYM